MTIKQMNTYDFSLQNKALVFDAELTSFLNPSSYSNNELELTSSDSLFPINSYSNAFNSQPLLPLLQDDLLSSPLGLSPYDFNSFNDYNTTDTSTTSPMLSTYSNSGSITGLDTPELGQIELPNLFFPTTTSSENGGIELLNSPVWDPLDINILNLQALLESTSNPSNTFITGTGAISPQLMKLDSPKLEDLILPAFSSPSTSTSTSSPILEKKKVVGGRKRKEIVLVESEVEEDEIKVEERVVFAKDKFNGTRNTKIKPIDFNAPTMSRSYVIPSITSRKRAPPAISAKLIPTLASNKKQKRSSTPIPFDEFNDEGCIDPAELPDELLSAIELKRRQNTLAARRSRMRKAAHLDGIKKAEDEARRLVEETKRELDEWKLRALTAEAELKRLRS